MMLDANNRIPDCDVTKIYAVLLSLAEIGELVGKLAGDESCTVLAGKLRETLARGETCALSVKSSVRPLSGR